MKKLWETGIILFSVWGFWGMIYPDLCFTEDVCKIVADDTMDGALDDRADDVSEDIPAGVLKEDIFTGLSGAKPEQIRMKSRILEKLKSESKGKDHGVSDGFSDE